MTLNLRKFLLPLIAALAVAGCAGDEEPISEVENIAEAYNKAQESIRGGNYRRGIQIFEAIQAYYPFSDLARQIQLELMYAYYKSGRQEQAVLTGSQRHVRVVDGHAMANLVDRDATSADAAGVRIGRRAIISIHWE